MGALNIRYNKVYIKYIKNLLGNYTVPSLFLIIILYLEARRYIIYIYYIDIYYIILFFTFYCMNVYGSVKKPCIFLRLK